MPPPVTLIPAPPPSFQVGAFLTALGLWEEPTAAGDDPGEADEQAPRTPGTPVGAQSKYHPLDCDTVKDYIVSRPTLMQLVGPASSSDR